jgi:hypothetical protein
MERRFVIAVVALILSLSALAAASLYAAVAPPATAPTSLVEQEVLRHGAVSADALAPAGMSGEFADRMFA